MDLFKLPGSSYIKPGLLSKTKDQLTKKEPFKVSTNATQKPSCELFAPQPKRIFTRDYSGAVPKHLLADRKRCRSPSDSPDPSPDHKQIKLSSAQATGQINVVSDLTKKKAFLLQKEKYLKRKIQELSNDLEPKSKNGKFC